MLAEQVTAWSALVWSTGMVLYVAASWAIVQLGWKFVQYRVEKAPERGSHEMQQEEVSDAG